MANLKALEEWLDGYDQAGESASGSRGVLSARALRIMEDFNAALAGGELNQHFQEHRSDNASSQLVTSNGPLDPSSTGTNDELVPEENMDVEPVNILPVGETADYAYEEVQNGDELVSGFTGNNPPVSENACHTDYSPECEEEDDEPKLLISESESEDDKPRRFIDKQDHSFYDDAEQAAIEIEKALQATVKHLLDEEKAPPTEKPSRTDVRIGDIASLDTMRRRSSGDGHRRPRDSGDARGHMGSMRSQSRSRRESYGYPRACPRRRRPSSTQIHRSRPLPGNPRAFEGKGKKVEESTDDESKEELRHEIMGKVSLLIPLDFNSMPISITMVNHNIMMYADFHKKRVMCIHLNELSKHYEFKKGEEYFNNPSAIATNRTRVAIRDDDGLHFFSVPSLRYICSTLPLRNAKHTFGVAGLSDDRFVTVDDISKRLLFFDGITGALLYDKPLHMYSMMRASEVKDSRFRVIHADKYGHNGTVRIAITDYALNKVFVVNESGSFLCNFGRLGSAEGAFNGPHGISSFPVKGACGGFIVADSFNNRYQVFNGDGEFRLAIPLVGAKGHKRLVGLHAWFPKQEEAVYPLPFESCQFLATSFKVPGIFMFRVARNLDWQRNTEMTASEREMMLGGS